MPFIEECARQGARVILVTAEKYGGYKALRKALTMTPEEIIATMKGSDVLGRGGAMFPVGLKWEMALSLIHILASIKWRFV